MRKVLLCARLSKDRKDSTPMACAMPVIHSLTECLTISCGFAMP